MERKLAKAEPAAFPWVELLQLPDHGLGALLLVLEAFTVLHFA